ncbi:MAG: Release factor glutamine methyltransferase [Microgenomates bacterium OLB23]|nr:MAG: Release factor glutamine methyltransferase [Microgenomates bacterium OLB23]
MNKIIPMAHFFKIINGVIKKESSILDIGCGTGSLAIYLASCNHHVLGIDISQKAIQGCEAYAQRMNVEKNTQFLVGTINDLPPSKKI